MKDLFCSTRKSRTVFFLSAYSVVVTCGSVMILWLKGLINTSDLALGTHTISMFIPYSCVAIILFFVTVLNELNIRHAISILGVFIVLSSCFFNFFMEPISHVCCDDSYWSSFFAHHMLEHRSLSGNAGTEFYHQPGARYYLAAMFTLTGGENRLMQLVNMFFYLTCMLAFLLATRGVISRRHLALISIFCCLSLPYVAKNVLQGLSEWLAVTMFFVFGTMFLRNRFQSAILALAFIPFFRQNYAFASIYIFSLMQSRSFRISSVLFFAIIIFLPVFHNFYFANKVQFIGTGAGIIWEGNIWMFIAEIINALRWEVPAYLGYHAGEEFDTLVLAVIFAPFGTLLLLYFLVCLPVPGKFLYIGVAAITIGPDFLTFLLHAQPSYYPRFQYANQMIILGCVPLIYSFTRKAHLSDIISDRSSEQA